MEVCNGFLRSVSLEEEIPERKIPIRIIAEMVSLFINLCMVFTHREIGRSEVVFFLSHVVLIGCLIALIVAQFKDKEDNWIYTATLWITALCHISIVFVIAVDSEFTYHVWFNLIASVFHFSTVMMYWEHFEDVILKSDEFDE